MEPAGLHCTITFPENQIAVLQPEGDLSLQTLAPSALFRAVQKAVSASTGGVIFAFDKLHISDGFGLAHLLFLTIQLRRKGLAVAACGHGRNTEKLFTELCANRFLRGYSSLDQALEQLRNSSGNALRNESIPPAAAEIAKNPSGHELLPSGLWPDELGPTVLTQDGDKTLNLNGRRPQGPGAGFGSLWQKTYKIRLVSQKPDLAEIAARLKNKLPEYWPAGNRIVLPEGLQPGAPGIINLTLPGGLPLNTGIRVLNVSELAFSFVPLQGHMEAGWISFGVTAEDGCPTVVVQSLARTGDPFYELGFDMFGHRQQEEFWNHSLSALALDFDENALVEISATCLDSPKNWSGWTTLWWNAALRAIAVSGWRRLRIRRRKPDPVPSSPADPKADGL
ncbi:MAG: anti-sigma factor antagonist [Deltaproteobacteria bacterium]|nr:anti-sigma factor antagonist [Deltaproteobacteria bacterium]